MKHKKSSSLKEMKLNINQETEVKEMSKEHIDKMLLINNEILQVLTRHNCTVGESFTILTVMLESMHTYAILKDFKK